MDSIEKLINEISSFPWPPVSPIRRRRPRGLRSRNKRRVRFLKKWVWESTEVNGQKMNATDIFLGASDVSDYITGQLMFARNDNKIETHLREFTIIATRTEWQRIVSSSNLRCIQIREDSGLMIEDESKSYIDYNINSSSIVIKAYGDVDFITYWYEKLTETFEEVKNVIEWIYSGDGQSIEVPVRTDRVPVEEMYPFLHGESLSDYYDRFLSSSSSILLLIGPPGTGKTTFIRGLLQHAEISAMVTYDPNILSKDHIFANFIEGDRNVMIIEDADNFLGARSEGNDFMHKFLNVGDGLVTTKNKKMIFSTNLPSIRDVDPALIRPGRCFDILNFEFLTEEQATKLAMRLGAKYESKAGGKYSVADIFHTQVEAPKLTKRKVGFV